MEQQSSSSSSSSTARCQTTIQKRKQNSIIDLVMKRSIGAISSMEYKRRTILNKINYMAFSFNKTSLPVMYITTSNQQFDFVQDDIVGMEVDPIESRCLVVVSRYNSVAVYNISHDVDTFIQIKRVTIPHDPIENNGTPNSVHWIWDGRIFSVCTLDTVHFWDSYSCRVIETVKMQTQVLNHVMAAKKYSAKKYVAVAGVDGHVFIIDLLLGNVVMTMRNVESVPIKAIHWHPTNEFQYVTGNDFGNIHLWDLRFQKDFVLKFRKSDSFSKTTSHVFPVIGLRFYNDGNSIISVDSTGRIKTWEVNSGYRRPTHYEPVNLCLLNRNHIFKSYQFAVTENLKEDIAFMPSNKGMKIFDIESGENLLYSNHQSVPAYCATYDPQKFCVYAGSSDLVKLWSSDHEIRCRKC